MRDQGKDKEGNDLKPEDFKIDEGQLKAINEAKTSKNTGKFLLTYETPDGEKVTVEVLLTGTVEVSFIQIEAANHRKCRARKVGRRYQSQQTR